jgi:hypothetical protein
MANTYTLIASSTVGSGGAANISFGSIPQTYTDLCIKLSLRESTAGDYVRLAMNINTTAGGVTGKMLYGNGSSALSTDITLYSTVAWGVDRYSATANTFSNVDIYIPKYTSSNYKSFSIDAVEENNATASLMSLSAGLWSYTDAITTLTFTPDTRTGFAQYSTAYLYGIKSS